MKPVDIHTFVRDLKLAKCFTQKQCVVIENLFIYFNDLMVYKVIVYTNPDMSKKAKKLGFVCGVKTIFMDDVPICIKEYRCDKGKFIAVYNPNTTECIICTGEESEEQQIQKLKAKLEPKAKRPNIA